MAGHTDIMGNHRQTQLQPPVSNNMNSQAANSIGSTDLNPQRSPNAEPGLSKRLESLLFSDENCETVLGMRNLWYLDPRCADFNQQLYEKSQMLSHIGNNDVSYAFVVVPFTVEKVPSGPIHSKEERIALEDAIQHIVWQIRTQLVIRPVLTLRVLRNTVEFENTIDLYHALPFCGYAFEDGPWKDALVAFNFDPRHSPKSRIYQTITLEMSYDPILAPDAVKSMGDGTQISLPYFGAKGDPNSHIFSGKTIHPESNIWQLCDITDLLLRKIISTSALRDRACQKTGFYHNGTIAKIITIMRDKLECLRDGCVASDQDYACLMGMSDLYEPVEALTSSNCILPIGSTYSRKGAFLWSRIRNLAFTNSLLCVHLDGKCE